MLADGKTTKNDPIQTTTIPAPRIPTGECFVFNRSYRNKRIGDFLKELHITEGRSTGFPKIYRALKKNDSPLPVFETDEHNQYFLATIKIHEAFIDEEDTCFDDNKVRSKILRTAEKAGHTTLWN